MDWLPQRISSKMVVVGMFAILTVAAAGYMLYLSFSASRQHANLSFDTGVSAPALSPPPTAGETTVNSPFTTKIVPIIVPCRFNYFGACITPPSYNNTTPISTEKKYENFATEDIFFWLTRYSVNSLSTERVTLSEAQAKEYFPDYVNNTTLQGTVDVSMPVFIQRVAARQNINPRVLLTLMELLRQGNGLLEAPKSDKNPLAHPFFDTAADFPTQMIQVASELRNTEIQYLMQQKAGIPFPKKLVFFDKEYGVDPGVTPEDLSLVLFCSQHFQKRRDFEKAVSYFSSSQDLIQAQVGEFENFHALYQQLFNEDSLKNS